jgi:putative sigma-54 modulation protein
MHLNVTGHHVDVTPALRSYVEKKLDRIMRHFDQLIDTHFVLTVEKLQHKAEATLHVRGETIHAVAVEADMYASIDALADRLERRVRKHKEKLCDHHAQEAQKIARP